MSFYRLTTNTYLVPLTRLKGCCERFAGGFDGIGGGGGRRFEPRRTTAAGRALRVAGSGRTLQTAPTAIRRCRTPVGWRRGPGTVAGAWPLCGVINRWVSANRAVLVALSKCKRQDEDLPKPPALRCAVKGPRRAMRPEDRLIKAKGSLDRSDCWSTWATARGARFWSHYPFWPRRWRRRPDPGRAECPGPATRPRSPRGRQASYAR